MLIIIYFFVSGNMYVNIGTLKQEIKLFIKIVKLRLLVRYFKNYVMVFITVFFSEIYINWIYIYRWKEYMYLKNAM